MSYPPVATDGEVEIVGGEDAMLVESSCPCAIEGARRVAERADTRQMKMATTPGDVRGLLMHFPRASGPEPSLWMFGYSILSSNVGTV